MQGFKHIETDCQLSKDGIPVVIHNELLEKTTNGTGVCVHCLLACTHIPAHAGVMDTPGPWLVEVLYVALVAYSCYDVVQIYSNAGTPPCGVTLKSNFHAGKVCSHTADELRQLDAGSWFASEYAGQRIPLLSEVLELLADAHLHLVRTLDRTSM